MKLINMITMEQKNRALVHLWSHKTSSKNLYIYIFYFNFCTYLYVQPNLSSNNSQLSRYVVGIGIRLLNCLQNKTIEKFYSIRTFCYTLPKNIIKTLVEMSVEGNLWDGPLKRSVVILVSHA